VKAREKKIQELYQELQKWKSYIHFIDDEMQFIDRLLNSYVFEPRTPNLFERLELFKQKFTQSKNDKKRIKKLITQHEGEMAGILECTTTSCDSAYCQKHKDFLKRVSEYVEDYLLLKSEVYTYAGSVLRRGKPVG
jgi:hypothetical protein